MSVVYHGAPISTCDPIPLANPKKHTALPYITQQSKKSTQNGFVSLQFIVNGNDTEIDYKPNE